MTHRLWCFCNWKRCFGLLQHSCVSEKKHHNAPFRARRSLFSRSLLLLLLLQRAKLDCHNHWQRVCQPTLYPYRPISQKGQVRGRGVFIWHAQYFSWRPVTLRTDAALWKTAWHNLHSRITVRYAAEWIKLLAVQRAKLRRLVCSLPGAGRH